MLVTFYKLQKVHKAYYIGLYTTLTYNIEKLYQTESMVQT